MIERISYKGVIVDDTNIPGERKKDGVIPAHSSSSLQISRDRFILFISTLNTEGWDLVRSVIYQIRVDAPDGPVIKEGVLAAMEDDWRPLDNDLVFRKIYGMPHVMGVPQNASRRGKPFPNNNVFAVKAYCCGQLKKGGKFYNPDILSQQDDTMAPIPNLLHTVWAQFRLNEAGDDIEILQSLRPLRQRGYEEGEFICSLKRPVIMEHAMTPPLPKDEDCLVWRECHNFSFPLNHIGCSHDTIAPVEYRWNPSTGLYEWVGVGPLASHPQGMVIGESSISKVDGSWIVAARAFNKEAVTLWYKSDDLMGRGLGEPVVRPGNFGQRHSYLCPDGKLRLFINDVKLSPYQDRRNPLYMFEVNSDTFEYSAPVPVFDARAAGLPFEPPFVDMSRLCDHQGNRQILLFRAIASRMTCPHGAEITAAAMAAAGVHAMEITYDHTEAMEWEFD